MPPSGANLRPLALTAPRGGSGAPAQPLGHGLRLEGYHALLAEDLLTHLLLGCLEDSVIGGVASL